MNSIQSLRNQLNNLGVPYVVEGRRLMVEPTALDGFRVVLVDDEQKPEIHFDFWKYYCSSAVEAEALFLQGISGKARLRVLLANGQAVCWAQQTLTDGLWRPGPVAGKVDPTTAVDTVYLVNDHVRQVSAPPPEWDSMNTGQLMLRSVV